MTGPAAAPPGWYTAAGDPPDTMRQWDGTTWIGDPVEATVPIAPVSTGVRVGAGLIDLLVCAAVMAVAGITTAVVVPVLVIPALTLAATATLWLLPAWCTSRFGGSIGKLATGLRVVGPDGHSPPDFTVARRRYRAALITLVPLAGPSLALAYLIANTAIVDTDTTNRYSLYDRAGHTRVVRRWQLQ